jgi:hypothetical protein
MQPRKRRMEIADQEKGPKSTNNGAMVEQSLKKDAKQKNARKVDSSSVTDKDSTANLLMSLKSLSVES